MKRFLLIATAASILATAGMASAETTLRAAHQYPGGQGDARDEMLQIMAREVSAAGVDLKIQIFPSSSLFKATEQWGAITRAQLDISSFPLDYASGRIPQFSATLMPGLVRNYDRARRLNKSDFMKDIKALAEKNGAVILADAWLAGGFASTKNCITDPDSIKGQSIRGAGPAFEQMLAAAGASVASMPSSEIYVAMQTGVLDATNTSNNSFISYRLYEHVKCLTAPGDNALWFFYHPVIMSKKVLDSLQPEQQQAIWAAARKAEEYFTQESLNVEKRMVDVYTKAGVEVVTMSEDDFAKWMAVAKDSSYKNFAAKVKGGDDLLKKALAVE